MAHSKIKINNLFLDMIIQSVIGLGKLEAVFGALLLCAIIIIPAIAEEIPDTSRVTVKVDSDGLRAEIVATGKASPPDGMNIENPQARVLASKEAATCAYNSLVNTVECIASDYFPKERYFSDIKSISGARLSEIRYLGDGSVEADVELAIALKGSLTNKFEKEMRIAGYKVYEYDRPGTEVK